MMKRKIIWTLALLLVFAFTIQPSFADDDKYKENKYEKKEKKDKKKKEYRYEDDDDYEYYMLTITDRAVLQSVEQIMQNMNFTLMDQAATSIAVILKNNELFVSINELYSYLNLRLEWFGKEQIMTLTNDQHSIFLKANKSTVYIDGKKRVLVNPPVIENGVMYIPLQLLSDTFGLDVAQNDQQINLAWKER